ncbi:hypothetical protein K474DRAFT_720950 [Panus rudis PR-1116 ss-1]|nr:hypothetical protein K474DRAFT_720950 [Panus rudis PR-1116 ss-1]
MRRRISIMSHRADKMTLLGLHGTLLKLLQKQQPRRRLGVGVYPSLGQRRTRLTPVRHRTCAFLRHTVRASAPSFIMRNPRREILKPALTRALRKSPVVLWRRVGPLTRPRQRDLIHRLQVAENLAVSLTTIMSSGVTGDKTSHMSLSSSKSMSLLSTDARKSDELTSAAMEKTITGATSTTETGGRRSDTVLAADSHHSQSFLHQSQGADVGSILSTSSTHHGVLHRDNTAETLTRQSSQRSSSSTAVVSSTTTSSTKTAVTSTESSQASTVSSHSVIKSSSRQENSLIRTASESNDSRNVTTITSSHNQDIVSATAQQGRSDSEKLSESIAISTQGSKHTSEIVRGSRHVDSHTQATSSASHQIAHEDHTSTWIFDNRERC